MASIYVPQFVTGQKLVVLYVRTSCLFCGKFKGIQTDDKVC